MAKSPLATLKYFSTLLVFALALVSLWWLWNDYMQGPWTRDGKVRAELVSITPQVSGKIVRIGVKDNQLVKAGDLSLPWIPSPIASRWTTPARPWPRPGRISTRRSTRRTVARASPAPSSPPRRWMNPGSMPRR